MRGNVKDVFTSKSFKNIWLYYWLVFRWHLSKNASRFCTIALQMNHFPGENNQQQFGQKLDFHIWIPEIGRVNKMADNYIKVKWNMTMYACQFLCCETRNGIM